jgi:hypothetical protein
MPEYRLKTGEEVSGDLEMEDEKYIYLRNALVKNPDGSITSYVRFWFEKANVAVEEIPAEEVTKSEAEIPKEPEVYVPKRGRKKTT